MLHPYAIAFDALWRATADRPGPDDDDPSSDDDPAGTAGEPTPDLRRHRLRLRRPRRTRRRRMRLATLFTR